jgi:4-alpha-glucanotransferase
VSGHDDALRQLADAAGLCEHWTDFRGQPRQVPLDTLRSALAALGLPAASAADVDASRERLRAERSGLPPLIVARCGDDVPLPAALSGDAARGTLRLALADGASEHPVLSRSSDGRWQLRAPPRPGYHRLQGEDAQLTLAVAARRRADGSERRFALAAQLYGLRRSRALPESAVGDIGLGDFGALATLARQAGRAGADALLISPVHALFSADPHHFSPYSPSSRLFLNALYVDPAALAGEGWLGEALKRLGLGSVAAELGAADMVDWPRAATLRLQLLRALWQDFTRLPDSAALQDDLDTFRREGGAALADHARFEAIHAWQFGVDPARWHWRDWPAGLRRPGSADVEHFARDNRDAVDFHTFLQWLAARGLDAAHRTACEAGMGIGLVTDLAVGTDSGGSHAWSRQDDMLDGLSIGAPPDALNGRGQDWGLSTFSPRALLQHGFEPFIELLRASLRHAGGVRVDHILGLNRMWVIPRGAEPTEGVYLRYPLQDMLGLVALEAGCHQALVIGEDLGTVPAGLRDTLRDDGVLGMRVLWFERDHGLFVEPSRWSTAAIATTATHDVPTVAGWWRGHDIELHERLQMFPDGHDAAQERLQRARDRQALWSAFIHAGVASGDAPADDDPQPAVDAAVDFIAATSSPLAVIPLEDLLGSEEQPNLPGTTDQHPNWRRRLPLAVDALLDAAPAAARLRRLEARRGRP